MQLKLAPICSIASRSTNDRLRGLDTLRAIATVLVVVLHAGIPYMTKPIPHLAWPARDAHPSSIVDGLCWSIECCIMPVFFVLAGFCSKACLDTHGASGFLQGRTRRLLLTQLAAMFTVLPMCIFVWSIGWMIDGVYAPMSLATFRLPPELEGEFCGVAHLWFLQNLYVYCLVLCGIHVLNSRNSASKFLPIPLSVHLDRGLRHVFRSAWLPILAAIPTAIILAVDTRIVLGFYQSFTPVLSKLVYYGVYFSVGVSLYRHRDHLDFHSRAASTYLAIAGLLFAAALPMIHQHLTNELVGSRLVILASIVTLFSWFATLGLIGSFLGWNLGGGPISRYLADASFWIYLIHLPLVTLTHVAIQTFTIPTEAKFAVAAFTALSLSLMTFHAFVRDKWIGDFLKGRARSAAAVAIEPAPILEFPTMEASVHLEESDIQEWRKSA